MWEGGGENIEVLKRAVEAKEDPKPRFLSPSIVNNSQSMQVTVENDALDGSNSGVATITPPKRPKSGAGGANSLSVSKCIVYVYHSGPGQGSADIGIHDVVQIEGRLCEGEDRSCADEWDGMDVDVTATTKNDDGKPEKLGVSEIHCTSISVGRTPPPLTVDQVNHLKAGSTYDALVNFLSGSSPTGMGMLRAAIFAAWVMGWREGDTEDIGGVDLVIDGDRDGFMKLVKYFASSGILEIDGAKEVR